jgi:hypothetical protein
VALPLLLDSAVILLSILALGGLQLATKQTALHFVRKIMELLVTLLVLVEVAVSRTRSSVDRAFALLELGGWSLARI